MERELYCVCVVSFDNEAAELKRLTVSLEAAVGRTGLSNDSFCLVTLDNGDPLDWPSCRIRHVQADRVGNVGFAQGSNLLARKAKQIGKPAALIFANPDGAFHPDCLSRLLEANRKYPSDILEARQFPEEHPKSYSRTTGKTEWASGACLLVPMTTFDALNGFDERFFLYMEDIDLSWRARCNNYDVRVVADALYSHNVVNRSESQNAFMRRHMATSSYKLALKWGRKLKIEQPQISRWIKGQEPERKNYDRIVAVAHEMGVLSDMRSEDVAATLPERQVKTVKLKGYVGASGEAFYYRLADEDLEEVTAPDNATDQTVAVEVRGKSLGPALESWLVFYADVRSPITPDMLNQLCVVGLADDRLLVKKIERKDGQLVLVSNNGEPDIVAPPIEWAAKVTSMRPR